MPKDSIEGMNCFARCAGDDRLVKRGIAIGDGGVDFYDWIAPIMGVNRAAAFTLTTKIEVLAIGRGALGFSRTGTPSNTV